ncbi:copper resistance protein NlpE N-terminal domain-containing protein [Psychrobacter aestuarii]
MPSLSPRCFCNARLLSLSIAASMCLALVGCDSQSANAPIQPKAAVNADSQLYAKPDGNPSQLAEPSMQDAAIDADSDDTGGRPLLASAQSDTDVDTATNNKDKEAYSLEATLIGDYGGTVPCGDCERIDVTLNLFSDGSVAKTSVYQHQTDKPQSTTQSGIYRQDERTITIVYENQELDSYHIDGNYLVRLNDDDQPDDDYTLSRL